MEIQNHIDRLKKIFISESCADEIKKAKQEFIAMGGDLSKEIEGDSELLEIFFDWYLFERPLSLEGLTPVELFLKTAEISEDDRQVYLDFTKPIHSIFVVKKASSEIKLQDIFTKNKYVLLNISSTLLEKGDVAETRILPFKQEYRFSGAFFFYPHNIYPIVKAKAKEARKKRMKDFSPLICKFRQLKTMWNRCSNMDIEKVYKLMEEGLLV